MWRCTRDTWFADIMQPRAECPNEATDAEDPLMLIYTSGTTGEAQARRPHALQLSDQGGTWRTASTSTPARRCWVSDIGWMMGPWEIFGMTLLGGTFVMADGALDYPGPDRLLVAGRTSSRQHPRSVANAGAAGR